MRRTAYVLGWLICLGAIVVAFPAAGLAQDLDDLDDLDEDVVTEKPFEPGIEVEKWELIFEIGYMDFGHELIQADQILVDWNAGDKIFADMALEGETFFAPQVKLGRNWEGLSFENAVGFSLGDYLQTVSNLVRIPFDSDEQFTENDAEKGSLFMWFHEHSLTYHVLSKGRLLPFVSIGIGSSHYNLDSRYIDGSVSSFSYSYGGGLRIIGDDLLSVRMEVRNYTSKVQFHHASALMTNQINPDVDDDLVNIPLTQLDSEGEEIYFSGFAEETFNNLWYSVGIVASF